MTRHTLLAAASAASTSPSSRSRAAVLATSPVGYWRWGEASGTVSADVMGANDGTYVDGPTLGVAGLLTGDSDTAVTLNGTTQYISVPDAASLRVSASFSFGIWIARSAIGAGDESLFSKLGTGHTPLFDMNAGVLRIVAPGLGVVAHSSVSITDTNTHFLTATFDGAVPQIYIDAVEVSTGLYVGNLFVDGTSDFLLGSGFFGSIDDGVVWNRALSPTEVAALYAAGTGL